MSKNYKNLLRINCWEWILETIGNWNSQLLRELKNRVSWLNVAFTILGSIGLQIGLVYYIASSLPHGSLPNGSHGIDRDYTYLFNSWIGAYVAAISSWVTFVLMAAIGTYLIASNFYKEAQQSTLDFLRLVPHSTSTVLIGKLLGVPVTVYLAGACALPLQIYAARGSQTSWLTILSWMVALGGTMILFYLSAALVTLWFKMVPILLAILTFGLSVFLVFSSFNWSIYPREVQWYGISWCNPLTIFFVLTTFMGMSIYFVYKALDRIYNNITVLSRKQSYFLSFSYHLFLLGFYITKYSYVPSGIFGLSFDAALQTSQSQESVHPIYGNLPGVFWSLLSFWLLSLISSLQPNTRILINWAKYKTTKYNYFKILLLDDRSPATLAVLVNLGIAILVWSIPNLAMLPIHEISGWAKDEGGYSVTSFGIDYSFWLAVIFMLMLFVNIITPSIVFERIRNSLLWRFAKICIIIYPTIYWEFGGHFQ